MATGQAARRDSAGPAGSKGATNTTNLRRISRKQRQCRYVTCRVGRAAGEVGACETLYGTEGGPSWDQAAGAGRELTPDMEETQDKHSPHPPDCSTVQCISGKQILEHLVDRLKCIMSIFDHTVSETIWSKQFMRSKLRKEGACFWSN